MTFTPSGPEPLSLCDDEWTLVSLALDHLGEELSHLDDDVLRERVDALWCKINGLYAAADICPHVKPGCNPYDLMNAGREGQA